LKEELKGTLEKKEERQSTIEVKQSEEKKEIVESGL
jgi:hypothetical protein